MSVRVPTCVFDIIGEFAFSLRYEELRDQLDVCAAVQKAVPPSFLQPNAWYRSGNWGFVNNPLRRGNAFLPITDMVFTKPWGHLPSTVCRLLDRRAVRELKTYRAIFFRRVNTMERRGLMGWNSAFNKSLRHIRPAHFTVRALPALVQCVCAELSEACPIPFHILYSRSLLRASRPSPAAL